MSAHRELAQKHLPWNFGCHFWEGVLSVAGYTVFGVFTVLPGLLHEIVVRAPALEPYENRLVTALPICFWSISPMVGFFFTGYYESLKERLHLLVKWGVVGYLPFAAIAIGIAFISKLGYVGYLVLLYVSLIVHALINGFKWPLWLDLIGRQIPARRRGRLFGGRDALGNLIGIGAIATLPFLGRRLGFPYNYAVLYGIVVVFIYAGLWVFARLREIPYAEHEIRPRPPMISQIKGILSVLKEDKLYRNLMIATVTTNLCMICTLSLYQVKATRLFDLSGLALVRFVSGFTIANTLGYMAGMPLLGLVADRWGYKRVIYSAHAVLFATLILVLWGTAAWFFLLASMLAGITRAGRVLATINFQLEFAPETRRPTYVALAALFGFPIIVVPLIGGWIADRWGYDPVFLSSGVFILIGMAMFAAFVREPRNEPGEAM